MLCASEPLRVVARRATWCTRRRCHHTGVRIRTDHRPRMQFVLTRPGRAAHDSRTPATSLTGSRYEALLAATSAEHETAEDTGKQAGSFDRDRADAGRGMGDWWTARARAEQKICSTRYSRSPRNLFVANARHCCCAR